MTALSVPFRFGQLERTGLLGLLQRHGQALFLAAMLVVSIAVLFAPAASETRCLLRSHGGFGRGEGLLLGLGAASAAWIGRGHLLRRFTPRQAE